MRLTDHTYTTMFLVLRREEPTASLPVARSLSFDAWTEGLDRTDLKTDEATIMRTHVPSCGSIHASPSDWSASVRFTVVIVCNTP